MYNFDFGLVWCTKNRKIRNLLKIVEKPTKVLFFYNLFYPQKQKGII